MIGDRLLCDVIEGFATFLQIFRFRALMYALKAIGIRTMKMCFEKKYSLPVVLIIALFGFIAGTHVIDVFACFSVGSFIVQEIFGQYFWGSTKEHLYYAAEVYMCSFCVAMFVDALSFFIAVHVSHISNILHVIYVTLSLFSTHLNLR